MDNIRSDEGVKAALGECANTKGPALFSFGMMSLEYRRAKSIKLEGNYIEKEEAHLDGKYDIVELQWLEHLWDHRNLFEIWVVRATED